MPDHRRTLITGIIAVLIVLGGWLVTRQSQLTKQFETLNEQVAQLSRELAESRRQLPIPTADRARLEYMNADPVMPSETPATPDPDAPFFQTVYQPDGSWLDDPFLGPKDANVILMAFSSYDCKTCRSFYNETLPKLREEFIQKDQVRFIFRDFPVQTQARGIDTALAANCAARQGGYWKIHDLFFTHPDDVSQGTLRKLIQTVPKMNMKRYDECIKSSRSLREIQADTAEAVKLGGKGSPGFFLGKKSDSGYRGVFIRGSQPYEVFRFHLARMVSN